MNGTTIDNTTDLKVAIFCKLLRTKHGETANILVSPLNVYQSLEKLNILHSILCIVSLANCIPRATISSNIE